MTPVPELSLLVFRKWEVDYSIYIQGKVVYPIIYHAMVMQWSWLSSDESHNDVLLEHKVCQNIKAIKIHVKDITDFAQQY